MPNLRISSDTFCILSEQRNKQTNINSLSLFKQIMEILKNKILKNTLVFLFLTKVSFSIVRADGRKEALSIFKMLTKYFCNQA